MRGATQGVIHADLKPLNAVRVRDKSSNLYKWKLIDLDGAAELAGGVVGLKSSTGARTAAGLPGGIYRHALSDWRPEMGKRQT